MNHVSTYQNQPSRTKGIGMALAVHGAIIGAVMMMPGIEIPERIQKPVIGVNIPLLVKAEPLVEDADPIVKVPTKPEQQKLPPLPGPETVDSSAAEFAPVGGSISGMSGAGFEFPISPVQPIQPVLEPVIVNPRLDNRYARQFQPPYPPGQLRLEQEGIVSVRVLVGADGRVKDIELIDSPHNSFWKTTRRHALKKWRFTPATRDGVPFESWMEVKVRFEIAG